MEFLGIGYQELLLVLVLLLVVVGPERLPAVAYQLGRAVRTLQQYARAVRDEFSDEIGYVEEQYKVIKGEVDTARSTLREEEAKMTAEMREATDSLKLPDDFGTASSSPAAPEAAPSRSTTPTATSPGERPARARTTSRTSTIPSACRGRSRSSPAWTRRSTRTAAATCSR